MEFLLFKSLGYLFLVGLPAKILIGLAPPRWRRILAVEIWSDPR